MIAQDLATALERLAEVLQTQRTLGAALAGIAEAAVTSIPVCDAASVALSIEGRPATAAATARLALELDMVQYDAHDGPCLTSFRDVRTLRLNLVEPGDDFPHFAVAARSKGVRHVLSVPAIWRGNPIATLNLYSRGEPFEETSIAAAELLAAQVAIAVSRSPEFAAARATVEQTQSNAVDRADMELAAGLLMGTQGCSAEQAEGLLREAAEHEAQTLLEIAQRIITEHERSSGAEPAR